MLAFHFLIMLGCLRGTTTSNDGDYHDRGSGDFAVFTYPPGAKDAPPLRPTSPGIVLMGDGPDVVAAFEWQVTNARGGDLLVMHSAYNGTDAYNAWVYNLSTRIGHQLNSVTTLVFHNRNASFAPSVLALIDKAEGIFFGGGDQSVYLQQWAGTPVQALLQAKLADTTMGASSAGLGLLGQCISSAETGVEQSSEALRDPYSASLTLPPPAFLQVPLLDSVLVDALGGTRQRVGRLLALLARDLVPPRSVALGRLRGLGIDAQTALLLDVTTGAARVVGRAEAYVCVPTVLPSVCAPGLPLTFAGVECVRLASAANASYNFASRRAEGGVAYVDSVARGDFVCQGARCDRGPALPVPAPVPAPDSHGSLRRLGGGTPRDGSPGHSPAPTEAPSAAASSESAADSSDVVQLSPSTRVIFVCVFGGVLLGVVVVVCARRYLRRRASRGALGGIDAAGLHAHTGTAIASGSSSGGGEVDRRSLAFQDSLSGHPLPRASQAASEGQLLQMRALAPDGSVVDVVPRRISHAAAAAPGRGSTARGSGPDVDHSLPQPGYI